MTPLRILLVEDSPDDAELLLYHLRQSIPDLTCERVEHAEQMRAALASHTWDIVISDYALPRFSGEEALKVLQSTGQDIPFIVVSGAIGEESAVEIMRAGAHDYVMKNNLRRLVPAIQRELREADDRRAHRASQDALRRSEAQMRALLDATTDIACLLSADGTFLTLNRTMAESLGKSVDELVGQNAFDYMNATVRAQRLPYFQQVLATGQPVRWQDDTTRLYWDTSVYPVMSPDGSSVEAFAVYSRDITEQKQLEIEVRRYTSQLESLVEARTAELRRAKEEIELILNNTTDAIALAQSNGDIRAHNPSFVAVFGELHNRNIERILWTFDDEAHINSVSGALVKMLYDQERQRVEAQITDDETRRDIDLSFIPVRMDSASGDERPDILVTAHDITPMKEVERFKSRFIADAVHDLATPITGLSTRIYLLKHSPEKLSEHLRALENQVDHLRNLLDDLRTLSQFDRREFTLDLEPHDLNHLARRVFDTYEPVAIGKNQSLTLNPDPALPPIRLDARRMERVLVNLISNAVNYTPEGKRIIIETRRHGDHALLTVADEGIGIKPEELERIFERFYRTELARRTHSAGTGLGLAITKEVVAMHGGAVSVTSQPGVGSTFTIRLPL